MRVRVTIAAGIFFGFTYSASAYEAFKTHPGTRAMGMAGVFVAQADDGSAIWYNPAGPRSDAAAKADVSIELANTPRVNNNGEYSHSGVELKFIGGYTEKVFEIFGTAHPVILGAGYFLPYRTTTFVSAPRDALNATPFGDIDVTHRQVSGLIAASPASNFSWGATLDGMWSEIRCRDYDLCVKNGPIGFGASLGAKYSVAEFSSGNISIAAVWHSRIALRYTSRPSGGLGGVVEDYLPGRPQSFALGANVRMATRLAAININGQAERIEWSDTIKDASIADHRKFGASAEALFPMRHDNSFAFRMGASRSTASGAAAEVRILATSIGYSFMQHHSIDIALERRALNSNTRENFASLSYSMQR